MVTIYLLIEMNWQEKKWLYFLNRPLINRKTTAASIAMIRITITSSKGEKEAIY